MSTVYDSQEMTDEQRVRASKARDAFKKLDTELVNLCPNKKRFYALAKTKIEEAAMWATKAIAFEGKDLG